MEMSEITNQKDAPNGVFVDIELAPTWDDMRAGGCMVADEQNLKVAVYEGGLECVVLRTEEEAGSLQHLVLPMGLIPKLLSALAKSMVDAELTAQAAYAEVEAHLAQD